MLICLMRRFDELHLELPFAANNMSAGIGQTFDLQLASLRI